MDRATERGDEQLAAVLLLAQSNGYRAAGIPPVPCTSWSKAPR
ncbi:MAG TPA: hypothetical protein VN327_01315 [Pseudonocardiaceae bacterium]|jgi:hypothetical protein|nr:hypothetical protein [Pseudonocardiaceae bacterium]